MNNSKTLLEIALPAMAENFLQFLMGLVDSYLVAFLGLAAISGVSIANNILSVVQALFLAVGAAVSSVLAHSLGQGNQKKLIQQATDAVGLTIFLGLVLGVFFGVASQQVFQWLGTQYTVAAAGKAYLTLVGGGTLFLGLMLTLGAIHRASGRTRFPMYVSILSNVLNAVFSAIAVFLFQAGIFGVAIGTILARFIACVILFWKLPFDYKQLRLRVDPSILRLALPSAGERLMMRAGDVVVVSLIVSLGTATIAGNAIGETLTQFNYMPALGMATATLIVISQTMGQGKTDQIRPLLRLSLGLAMIGMLCIAGMVYLLGRPFAQFYSQDEAALAASQLVLFYSLLGTPVTVGTMVYTALWQAIGNARLPFVATAIGMWGIRIGLGYLLTVVWKWGLSGVWVATLADNFFRWLFLSVLFWRWQRREKNF